MDAKQSPPLALDAASVPPRTKPSNYPARFARLMQGRVKRPLGDLFGLSTFGVNLTTLAPGAMSALRHAHTRQDEFIYVLEGTPSLHTDEGETELRPGMCAGFRAGTGNGHRLINRGTQPAVYLEIGDRGPGDEASYPDDDLKATMVNGAWVFTHTDGRPWGPDE